MLSTKGCTGFPCTEPGTPGVFGGTSSFLSMGLKETHLGPIKNYLGTKQICLSIWFLSAFREGREMGRVRKPRTSLRTGVADSHYLGPGLWPPWMHHPPLSGPCMCTSLHGVAGHLE